MNAHMQMEDWRLPGCDQRCQRRTVIAPGILRRVYEPVHDPDAHEEYGRQSATGVAEVVVRTGALTVNLTARTVALAGQEVVPTGREWQVLAYLAEARGGYRTTVEIMQILWPGIEGAALLASINTARIWVGRVRGRLYPATNLIESTEGRGYRLVMMPITECLPVGPTKRWARNYDACVRCHTTSRQHDSHGLCVPCRTATKELRRQAEGRPS